MADLLGVMIFCTLLAPGPLGTGACHLMARGLAARQAQNPTAAIAAPESDTMAMAPDAPVVLFQPGDNPLSLGPGTPRVFELQLPAPGLYRVETVDLPAGLDPILAHHDPVTGELIAEDDDGGEGYGSRLLVGWSGAERPLFRVADLDDQPGDLVIQVAAVPIDTLLPGTNPIELSAGEPRFFEFRPATAGLYRIETVALPEGFDPILRHHDPASGELLGEDDDGGEGYGARLHLPAAGDTAHLLQVAEIDGLPGLFELAVTALDFTPLALTGTQTPRVDQQIDASGSLWFRLTPAARHRYTVTTSNLSADLDTTLELFGPSFQSLGFDDDGGGDLASRLSWFAPVDTEMFLKIDNLAAVAGSFDLGVDAEAVTIEELPMGVSADHSLAANEQRLYRLSATAGQHYRITTADLSNGMDTLLRLHDPSVTTVLAEDDDGGENYGSHLEWTAPAAGDYWLEISNIAAADGSFRLRVEPPSP